MARFCTLSSSSKGNCMYISGGKSSLLVDVGISCKRIRDGLRRNDVELSHLDGIVITHEHIDHVKGLNVLLKQVDIPVYSSAATLEYLAAKNMVPAKARLVPVEEEFFIGDIQVTPFDTPHDAVHSIGVRMEMPDGNVVGVATDLGFVTDTVREHLEGCSLVLLESNFDAGMLSCSSYPYFLKLRIQSEVGHLANDDCANEIVHLVNTGTTRFILGHLSEENNVPVLAYETTKSALSINEMQEGKDYLLSVAPAKIAHEMVVF